MNNQITTANEGNQQGFTNNQNTFSFNNSSPNNFTYHFSTNNDSLNLGNFININELMGSLLNMNNFQQMNNMQQGQNQFFNVYSNVNGNSNNFNFNDDHVQQDQELEYKRRIKEWKNKKYSQLLRMRYCDYVKKNKKSERTKQDSCSICLEKYKSQDIVLEFNCNEHFFHKECLKMWIKNSEYCPLCKHDLLAEYRCDEEDCQEFDEDYWS